MGDLICTVFGHKLIILRQLSEHSEHLGCIRCLNYWVMNHEMMGFIPMDEDLMSLYRDVFKTFDQLVA